MKNSKTYRLFQMVHATAYAFALLAVPISHAVFEAAPLSESHIESESFEHEQAPHDEYMCQVCRLVDFSGLKSHSLSQADLLFLSNVVGTPGIGSFASSAFVRSHPSRAPPQV